MKTPEQLAMQDELTELLMQMDERQLHKAARFAQLFLGQEIPFEDAVSIVQAEFAEK